MKKILLLGGILLLPFLIQAQNVFSGEPVQWVGRPNGYSTTPYNSDYRTTGYRKISTTSSNPADGRGHWATTINVQSSGGNITPDNMPGGGGAGWLLISGPSSNRFQNKWNFGGVGQASINAINDITLQGGGQDMGLNMSTAGFYTFSMRDAGYANSQVYIGYTAAAPVTVSRTGQSFFNGQPVISISTGGTPSLGENIYVRYRVGTNDFTTGTGVVQASGSGSSWTATLPAQSCNSTVYYYVFTSTRTLTQINADTEQNRSLAVLRYDDNFGSNYLFTITQSTIAVMSGGATICADSNTNLQVAITGGLSPYTLVYTDGTSNFTVNNYISNATIVVSPSSTKTYSIVSVTGANGCAGIGNSGTALVTVNQNITYYRDFDGDGFGSDSDAQISCTGAPVGYVAVGGDCNDALASIKPGATEICYDGIDQNCDGDTNDGCPIITSRLRTENCDTNLTSLNQVVRGDRFSQSIPSGVSVTGYRFRVTNLVTNQVRIVERSNYVFQLSYTDFADYNTSYSVEVALRLNTEWMETYGAPCTITTPGVPNTVLATTSCGATLAQMNNIIRAVVVPSALSYEFEVSLIEGAVPVETTTLIKTGESFNLLQLSNISIKYGAEYSVRVKVQVPTSSGPQWSTEYGTACSVFTSLAPEAAIVGCGVETGIAPAAMSTTIFATPIGGATQYRFTMTDGASYNQVYTTPLRYFKLSNFNALQALTPGGTYSVSVEVQVYGFYYLGKDCNILVPGGAPIVPFTRPVVDSNNPMGEFKAVAYPNPFNNSFALDLKTSSTNPVSIAIYDMTGRLLELNKYNADSLAKQTIGERYPAGVYNVIVTQGENMQTVRVVKN